MVLCEVAFDPVVKSRSPFIHETNNVTILDIIQRINGLCIISSGVSYGQSVFHEESS